MKIIKCIFPIFLGFLIGMISNIIDSTFFVNILNTVSANILIIINFITPIMIFSIVAIGINVIEGNKIKFLLKFFLIIFLTLFILGTVVLGISLVVIPQITPSLEIASNTNKTISAYFLLSIKSPISIIQGVVLGLLCGIVLSPKSSAMKGINYIQKFIYLFLKKIILPIMPFWVIGSFAKMGYESVGSVFLISNLLLSILIIFLQIVWIIFAYYIVSLLKKINFQKILYSGSKIYFYVVSIAGMGTGALLPYIIEEEKKLGYDENKATVVTATSFNMPGSLVANIIFAVGIASMFNLEITVEQYFIFLLMLIIALMVAPAVPGGVFAVTSVLLTPLLGFTPDMINLFGTMYYNQGIPNAAANNVGDLYITPLI